MDENFLKLYRGDEVVKSSAYDFLNTFGCYSATSKNISKDKSMSNIFLTFYEYQNLGLLCEGFLFV